MATSGSGDEVVVLDTASQSVFPVNLYAVTSPMASVSSSDGPRRQHQQLSEEHVLRVIEIMSSGEKRKRGPKEKETFQRVIYCLPNTHAKLPKFSSFDQNEREIIKAHTSAGYGYPAQDLDKGTPRKTLISLSYTASQFREFIRGLYPKLANRMWDMYKIDRQRRLLRVEHDTPRGIKDTRYQGSLIVIPYDDDSERPPPVLYRTGEDYFIKVTSTTDDHMTYMGHVTPVSPNSSETPEVVVECDESPAPSPNTSQMTASVMSPRHEESVRKPLVSPYNTVREEAEVIMKTELPDVYHVVPGPSNSVTSGQSSVPQRTNRPPSCPSVPAHSTVHSTAGAKCKILGLARAYRERLQNLASVSIRTEHLVDDVMGLYRGNSMFGNHHIRVSMTYEGYQGHNIPAGTMFVLFWEEIFRQFFKGDGECVPVIAPDTEEDFYVILGRILCHGLLLFGYWPVKLVQACACVLFTDKCSDRQLTTSFYNVMTESEKSVLVDAKKEIKSNFTEFSLPVLRNLCRVLRFYGNVIKPVPRTFEGLLTRLSRYYLVRHSCWAVSGIKKGFAIAFPGLESLTESDVFSLYKSLAPNALTLFEKVSYVFTAAEINSSVEMEEKRTKMYLEVAIMRMTKQEMTSLLTKWCHFDCLCVDELNTRFHANSVSEPPFFDPDIKTLNLSSVYTSQEEFTSLLTSQIHSSTDVIDIRVY